MTREGKPDLIVSIPTKFPVRGRELRRIRNELCKKFDHVRMSFVDGKPRRLVFECRNVVEDWALANEKEEKK